MKNAFRIVALGVVSIWSTVTAQYYSDRALQKSFEQADFFFTPTYLNPFGIKGFSTVTAGLLNDPLLNLQINPASLYSDSLLRGYAYIDFRGKRDLIEKSDFGYVMPMVDRMAVYDAIYRPYPSFYVNTRKDQEPVFSAAYLARPLGAILPQLFLGATYQMILQDEKYYAIPQDIYRSTYGYDYAGMRTTDASATAPVIDKYSGADNMHQSGHFITLYTGYDVSADLQIGLKLSRNEFNREGSFGSRNFWAYAYGQASSSTWHNMESRTQDYRHWDLSSGVNYRLSEKFTAGLNAGYLWGNATQVLSKLDTSLYTSGLVNVGTNWNYSRRYAVTGQNWNQDGNTAYGGLNFSAQLNESQLFSFYYAYSRQSIDLLSNSSILDSSNYDYRYQYDTTHYSSTSRYSITDLRTGTGTTLGTSNRLLSVFRWNLEGNSQVSVGFSYQSKSSETNTNEPVKANRYSSYNYSSNYYNGNNFEAGSEEKNLLWTFKAKLTTIQIPVMFNLRRSETSEILIGINRTISSWEIEEVTTAMFKYRNQSSSSGSTSETNFGERYTSPKETVSDVSTTILLGITVKPSKLFNVRLLLTPTATELPSGNAKVDFQWWIGLSMFP
jgi:hypothetical protein